MRTIVRQPHPLLRGLVPAYYGYHYSGLEPGVHLGMPGTGLTVVLAFDEPLDVAWADDPASRVRQWTTVSGLHDRPALIHHDGFQHGVQLELTPLGARRLLGLPAAALHGALVPLGMDHLHEAVAAARSWDARFQLLDEALLELAVAGDGVRSELTWAWQRLHRNPAQRIAALAEELGWSRRHLASTFTAEYGVGPKQVSRLVRFQQARALLASGQSIGSVASETGFADQAHLTRDFRDLAGCTPGEWLRAEFPFLQDTLEQGRAG